MYAYFINPMHPLLVRLCLIIISASILLTISFTHSTVQPAWAEPLAAGLRGEYFDNEDFTNLKLTRTDATVDFSLGFGSPDPLINSETFSVRWTGQLVAPATGSYVLVTQSDDGVRLWLGNQMLIDNFTAHPLTENRSAAIALTAGQSYDIRVEYFELTANAIIRLMWIRPGQTSAEVIPSANLATPINPNPAPVLSNLSPSIIPTNSVAVTLTINGTNFLQGAVVQWNNAARATSFVSATQLTATIPATDLTTATSVKITAVNPLPGGGTSNPLPLLVSGGFEADVSPRPNGNNNGAITVADWTQLGRFSAALDTLTAGNEFQRADCAPRSSLGDGRITLTDWVQAGRYASALDPATAAGGPSVPVANALGEPSESPGNEPQIDPPADFSPALTGNLLEQSLAGLTGSRWRHQLALPQAARSVSAIAQSPDSIAIICAGQGGENAFGFSFNFDANQWQFISVAKGAGAEDAALFVNSRAAAAGRVGVAMALPPGHAQKAGNRQLVVLTFHSRFGNISDSFPQVEIDFADQPVGREVVDANAQILRADFVSRRRVPESPVIARSESARRR